MAGEEVVASRECVKVKIIVSQLQEFGVFVGEVHEPHSQVSSDVRWKDKVWGCNIPGRFADNTLELRLTLLRIDSRQSCPGMAKDIRKHVNIVLY
jgi:hypothetical protein